MNRDFRRRPLRAFRRHTALFALAPGAFSVLLAGCMTAELAGPEPGSSSDTSADLSSGSGPSRQEVGSLARANIGKSAGYCAVHPTTNSLGGHQFETSCSGNGGYGEYWCADFARWVWQHAGGGGITVSGLSPAAGSFYTYGQAHGTLHTSHSYEPRVGDAIVFNYHGGGSADHVGLVAAVHSDGSITTANGDFGGGSGSQAHFAETSSVESVWVSASQKSVGSHPSQIGMTISAYVSPHGLGSPHMRGAPFPLAHNSTHTQVFARAADNSVHRRYQSAGSGWSSWSSLNGQNVVRSNLAGISRDSNHMELFARGPDNALHHQWWSSGNGWSGWHSLGGDIRGTPAVVSRDSTHMQVFARGPNGAIHRRFYQEGSGWSRWYSMGGNFTGTPAVVSRDSTHMEVFARGADGAIHHRWWSPSNQWSSGWHSLDGHIASNPAVLSRNPTVMHLFGRGADGKLHQRSWSSDHGWGSWTPLGTP